MLLPTLFTVLCPILVVSGTPQIALPFNAQVPPVAHVSQPYSYQFPSSTFVSTTAGQLTYSLQNTPIWLQINSTTRTLYGTPGSTNLGPLVFNLLADDGDGHASMQATLIVVDSSAPQVGNITRVIAEEGPLSDTTTLSLRTGSSFSISMQDIFSSTDRPMYYATSIDHSPLPSWIQFDSTSLTFSGSTPAALSAPQTYGVSLHISTVEGFSEASASFSLAIGSHQLYSVPLQSQFSVPENGSVDVLVLQNALHLDNQTAPSQDIRAITYQGPEWLEFDNATLRLTGTAPSGSASQNITFTANDVYGDTAVSHLVLALPGTAVSSSIFAQGLSSINGTVGTYFSYTIPRSNISISDFSARLDIPPGYDWLSFVASNLTIHGNVPDRLSPGLVAATLFVTDDTTNSTESTPMNILFHCSSGKTNKDGSCQGTAATSSSRNHLSTGTAAAIGVVATLLGIAFLLALAYILFRTMSHDKPSRRPWISRPLGSNDHWNNDHQYAVGGLETDGGESATTAATARHQRMQSEGTYLEPADIDAIAAMNRTSLGTGALRAGRNPDSNYRNQSGDVRPKTLADTLRAKLGDLGLLSTKSSGQGEGPAPSLRIWAATNTGRRFHGDNRRDTLATPSLSSIGSSSNHSRSRLETATPQTMTAFHYPKPSTMSQRPPPIPSRSQERNNDIRLVSLAATAATPPQLPPIQSITSPVELPGDTRPVHEKRQSYIRNRATDRNKGSRNALFAAGAGLDESVERGRKSRLLAVPKPSAKTLLSSRSRSSSLGRTSRLPASSAADSASEMGKTADWTTVHDADEFDDELDDPVEAERVRQDKRMKWRDRLNRNSKGQIKGGSVFGGGRGREVSRDVQEEMVGGEDRLARTQSWIRRALSPDNLKRLSQQSPSREGRDEREALWNRQEQDDGRRLDDRMVSAATQASSTRAFL